MEKREQEEIAILNSLRKAVGEHLDRVKHWEETTRLDWFPLGSEKVAVGLGELMRFHADLLSKETQGCMSYLLTELELVRSPSGFDLTSAIQRSRKRAQDLLKMLDGADSSEARNTA